MKESKMVKIVLKIKNGIAGKIRTRGMLMGSNHIELRPRVFEFDKKELDAERKTKKFDHYMEIVEVKGLDKLKVGEYVDGKKGTPKGRVGRKDVVAENKLKELKEREEALEKREAEALEIDKDLVARDAEMSKREEAVKGK